MPNKVDESSNPDFNDAFQKHLREDFFAGSSEQFLHSREFANAWKEHAWDRTARFSKHMLPWILDTFDLKSADVLEIRCGTGSISAILQPYCRSLRCWEPDAKSLRAAKKRAELMKWNNIYFEEGDFTSDCNFVRQGGKADAVVFVGVIEKLLFKDLRELLLLSRRILRPEGVLIFGDVPNRLSAFDFYTSWLPFYQWLPPDIREEYYKFSHRIGFVEDVDRTVSDRPKYIQQHLQSWGNGVSYHDFELSFGKEVHDWIIADSWDERIQQLAPTLYEDQMLASFWEQREVKAHRGFARAWLYLIIKPPSERSDRVNSWPGLTLGCFDHKRRLSVVHIPKSAGTSLTSALAASIRVNHYPVGWDLSAFGSFDDFQSIDLDLRGYIWSSPEDVPHEPFLVAGHVSPHTFKSADDNTQLLTILREPLSRLISLWVFWRRGPDERGPWGNFAERIWLARKPLSGFLTDPHAAFGTDNAAVRLLLFPHALIPADGFIDPKDDDSLFEEAVRSLEGFDFVDFIENRSWLANLSEWLGRPIILGNDNVTDFVDVPFRSRLSTEVTSDALTLMKKRVRIDERIWNYVAGRHMESSELEALRLATFAATVARHAVHMQPPEP